VAAVILKATLDYPARFGPSLADDIRKWGDIWYAACQTKIRNLIFPNSQDENIFAYLWARTVACPTTGKPVPLSPNWWLSKDPAVAVKLVAEPDMDEPRFEIVRDAAAKAANPDEGTVSRGVGRSPLDRRDH
jgi:putative DNA methylase